MLEGSKKYTKDNPKTLSSNSTDGWFLVDDVFVKNLKAGTYTMSGKADAPWTVHDTSGAKKGKVGLWLGSTTPGLNVNITLGETVPKTIEVPKDGDYCVRVNLYSNGNDIVTHKFWDFKLEQGSIATPWMPSKNELQEQLTPWMPSLSEVTTADYPKYVGTYVDTNPVPSTESSKYDWDEMKYRVYLDGTPVGGSKLLSFDLENLKAGTSYNVQVSQINGNVESDKSESVAFKTTLTK